jgi:hypothetical protein
VQARELALAANISMVKRLMQNGLEMLDATNERDKPQLLAQVPAHTCLPAHMCMPAYTYMRRVPFGVALNALQRHSGCLRKGWVRKCASEVPGEKECVLAILQHASARLSTASFSLPFPSLFLLFS